MLPSFPHQVKIKEQPPGRKKAPLDSAEDDEEEDDDSLEVGQTPLGKRELLEGMVDLVQPGETVARAIQRLGDKGGTKSAGRQRKPWSRLKAEEAEPAEEGDPQKLGSPERKEQLERLSGLADQMVARGVYEIYQETREKLSLRLRALDQPPAAPSAPEPELDMFAEDIDEAKLGEKTPVGERRRPMACLVTGSGRNGGALELKHAIGRTTRRSSLLSLYHFRLLVGGVKLECFLQQPRRREHWGGGFRCGVLPNTLSLSAQRVCVLLEVVRPSSCDSPGGTFQLFAVGFSVQSAT